MNPNVYFRQPARQATAWRGLGAMLVAVFLAGCKPVPKADHGVPPQPGEEMTIAQCEPGKYGGTFVTADIDQPKTFNPLVPADEPSDMAQSYFLSHLVDYEPMNASNPPALATSWELADDKKTYTFHLRKGIKWSDGVPFTADDVIFSFDCIFAQDPDPANPGKMKPRFANRYYDQFYFDGKLLKYRKIDDYTVEIQTPEIYSPLINDLNGPYILPKHILEKSLEDGSFMKQWSTNTAIEHPEQLVGTGEFVVKAYRPAVRLVLAANPYYWKADTKGQRLPYVDFFIIQYVATLEMETMLFATGQSDAEWNPGVPGTDHAWVEKTAKTYDFTVHDMGPLPDAVFYYFNLDPGSSKEGIPYVTPYKLAWFSNKLFRQAIMYAFNREGVAKGVYFGLAEPEDSIINRGQPHWYDPNVRKYRYDPQKARDLLKEAGFSWDAQGHCVDKDGNKVAIELMLAEGSRRVVDISTVLKENLADIGIDIKLTYVEGSLMMQKVTNTFDYEMTVMGWADQAGETDPSNSKSMFRSNGEDHFWHIREKTPDTPWEKRVDDLMDEQERTFDQAERHRIFNEIQEIYSEELPLIFVDTPLEFEGIKNKWHNIKVPPSGSIIWNIEELWTDNPK